MLGGLERSQDVQGDLLQLYTKLRQFEQIMEQAAGEANKLGQREKSKHSGRLVFDVSVLMPRWIVDVGLC